jgi:formylmethanofuran dehydrogenase subunit C
MGITVEKIEDDEHFEYKGDVHLSGDIGKNATVIIKDGNLIVDGSIENYANVSLTQESNNYIMASSGSFFMNNVSIGEINTGKILSIRGNVGDHVALNSHNADFAIEGSVGNQCAFNTHNGEITTGAVGEGTSLETHNGNIHSGNVGKNSSLKTHNGDVSANLSLCVLGF